MYVDFSLLPGHSRLWIYQANRSFTPAEEELIRTKANSFCDQWAAHDKPLRSSFAIEHHQFLILAVDEGVHGASGCSIDSSVHMVQNLQSATGIDFFDRTSIAFLTDKKVVLVPLNQMKNTFADGTLHPGSLTFNPQVGSKQEWEKNWLIPAEKSWVARFFPKSTAA
jgi:hypothetical protein